MTDEEEKAQFLEQADRKMKADLEELKLNQYKYFSHQIEIFYDEAREALDGLYQQYLNREIDFETTKKDVLLIEHEYEKLKHDITEADTGEGVLITRQYLFESFERELAFYRDKLQSDIWAGGQSGELEEITSEIPSVILDLIKNSGLLEMKRDTTGRFKPNGGIKDLAIVSWIYDYSGYANELTAEVYTKFIYTTSKQSTIEDYMRRARKKS